MNSSQPTSPPPDKRKRKREKEKANKLLAVAAAPRTSSTPAATDTAPKTKKLRKPAPKEFKLPDPKPPKKPEILNGVIARMDPNLAADYVLQRLRRFEKNLSAVELDDRSVPAAAFLDTTDYTADRMLANLPDYLEKCMPRLEEGRMPRL